MPKKRTLTKEITLSKRLYIFCEGKNTEPSYLERYISLKKFANDIEIVKTNFTTPFEILGQAIKKKEELSVIESAIDKKQRLEASLQSQPDDEFWVLFDREDKVKRPPNKLASTFQKAKDNNINIAISNVCFEIWVLLHINNQVPACYRSYSDLYKNSPLKIKLRELRLPDEIKRKADADKIMKEIVQEDKIEQAKRLAIQMNKITKAAYNQNCPEYELNPYTGVYKLLDSINSFCKRNNC